MTVDNGRASMKVTAMLCNHAEAQNNLLYVSGAGVDRAMVPAGSEGPWGVSLGVGVLIGVPWSQTNQQHTLAIVLQDADGHPVELATDPTGGSEPVRVEVGFNIGRPPELVAGDEQNISFAVNWPALPLASLGQYEFVIEVDGSPEVQLPYRLTMPRTVNPFVR